ncbi:MAG: prephenate dehydrogenase/arogenate dehydrogenase family protein [Bacteroidales bacterium]|nr:prephenate dehydrogenase/arogenate dehydrogenase family protein [Bacteroidales bacterium]HOK98026.1 prephenate dehydrogenase/arogenate dehydrogenase family protein [Bacteroidales bacterium]HPO64438.1 prephenate dehydrogenase/arogenate dehydrogenase family protein [Bacteroidales bacterium]
MKILIVGAGNMGAWLVDALCLDHDIAVMDKNKQRLKFLFSCHRFTTLEEVREFQPQMVINAVSLQHTFEAFDELLPVLPDDCILSDIASVKNGLHAYYQKTGRRFVSTHPMFGPTFANIKELARQNAIIITEGDEEGKQFFRSFYESLHLNIFEYSFDEHDRTIAYSLTIPFVTTLLFGASIKKQKAPGTTFQKHMQIARGLMSENNYLLSEVLCSPYSAEQIDAMKKVLEHLSELIQQKNTPALHDFFEKVRKNIE